MALKAIGFRKGSRLGQGLIQSVKAHTAQISEFLWLGISEKGNRPDQGFHRGGSDFSENESSLLPQLCGRGIPIRRQLLHHRKRAHPPQRHQAGAQAAHHAAAIAGLFLGQAFVAFGHPRPLFRQPRGLRCPGGGVRRRPAGLQEFVIRRAQALALGPAQRCRQRRAGDQVAGALPWRGLFPVADRFAIDGRAQLLQLAAHPIGGEHRRVDRVGDLQLARTGHHQACEP